MKRRSARPFVVEIKNQPRTGRATHPILPGGDRIGANLWRGLLTAVEPGSAAKPPAETVPVPGDAVNPTGPAPRRILPNLMQPPASDTGAEAAEAVALVPCRRGRPRILPQESASESGPVPIAAATTATTTPSVPDAPQPPATTGPLALLSTASGRPRPALRRPDGLRLGERWKRRLSRFAR